MQLVRVKENDLHPIDSTWVLAKSMEKCWICYDLLYTAYIGIHIQLI